VAMARVLVKPYSYHIIIMFQMPYIWCID
jgi:hypothetical protein